MKDTDINGSLQYLDFMLFRFYLDLDFPHASQVGVTQSPTYQRLRETLYLVAGLWSRVLKLNKLNRFKFFEVLNLVFPCIYNEKD